MQQHGIDGGKDRRVGPDRQGQGQHCDRKESRSFQELMLFLLIALLGSIWSFGADTTVLGFIGHVIAGSVWAIFHILIVLLQAFIFMMLTLVYLGQAHDTH